MIINDHTPPPPPPPGFSMGLDITKLYQGYGGVAEPFPQSLMIDRAEYGDRINQKKKDKSFLSDLADAYNSPVKDQNGTNYCWANGPTRCLELLRIWQGEGYTSLSAASVAARVKNGANVGGWGREALEFISENGINTEQEWARNSRDLRTYDTAANKQSAALRKPTGWYVLPANDVDVVISAVLNDIPVAVGYNWWSHEVSVTALDWINNLVDFIIDNSWTQGWGDNGRGRLQGNRRVPDDAVCPRY